MSGRRRMRHVFIDAGDGITGMVRMRGPMTPETRAAFEALARAAATRLPAQGEPPKKVSRGDR